MKKQISQLAAFLIFVLGLSAVVLLTAAKANNLLNWLQFIGAIAITVIVLYLDAKWIDRNFADGEWI